MVITANSWKARLFPGSEKLVDGWLNGARVAIRLTSSRVSKHGDFRIPRNGTLPLITINHDLHPVEFLITFCHELAHYRIWKRAGRKVRPHGPEWKHEFRLLLVELLNSGLLEPEIAGAVYRCYFRRESIGSGSCEHLHRALGSDPGDPAIRRVADLAEGEVFRLRNGRVFIKGPRARTRYHCKEKHTGRVFAVHPMAEVL